MSSVKIVLCIVMVLFLSGFKRKVKEGGYVESNQNIQLGFAKEQVKSVMGSPSVISDLSGKWYYISTITTKDFLGLNKDFSAKVIEVSFEGDRVHDIKNDVIPKNSLPKINPDSSIVNEENLQTKIINAFKRLNPSL